MIYDSNKRKYFKNSHNLSEMLIETVPAPMQATATIESAP